MEHSLLLTCRKHSTFSVESTLSKLTAYATEGLTYQVSDFVTYVAPQQSTGFL